LHDVSAELGTFRGGDWERETEVPGNSQKGERAIEKPQKKKNGKLTQTLRVRWNGAGHRWDREIVGKFIEPGNAQEGVVLCWTWDPSIDGGTNRKGTGGGIRERYGAPENQLGSAEAFRTASILVAILKRG